jgi:hypothetical protein
MLFLSPAISDVDLGDIGTSMISFVKGKKEVYLDPQD